MTRHPITSFHVGQLVAYQGDNPRHKDREMQVVGVSTQETEYDHVVCLIQTSAGDRLQIFSPKDLRIIR